MNPWNTYRSRINAHGITKRDSVLQRERAFLSAKLPASLSYHQLTVNGTVRNMAVINSDNLNLKALCTMPGEDLPHGGLVEWMGNHWLITEKDANNELYTNYDSKNVLAYRLTKPFKLGGSYNGEGVLNFVLTECNTEDSDNIELHIANYYDHFPKEKPDEPDTPSGDNTPDVPDGKKVWF